MSNFTTGRSLDHMTARMEGVESFARMIANAMTALSHHIRRERTRRELLELDDRMLRDIGLSRMDLRSGRFELNRINWSGRGHPSGM